MAEARRHTSLGEYLVREGIISQSQFNEALLVQSKTFRSMGRILMDLGFITENMRMMVLRKQFGFDAANLKDAVVPVEVLQTIPQSFADKHRVVPLRVEGGSTLVVAMEDPSDLLVVDAIKNQVGLNVRALVAGCDEIQAVLDRYQNQPEAGSAPVPETAPEVKHSLVYRILRVWGFYILAFLPIALFFLAIKLDWWDLQKVLSEQQQLGNLRTWDLSLYIALIWGLWTIILFEVNGLIFNPNNHEDEE